MAAACPSERLLWIAPKWERIFHFANGPGRTRNKGKVPEREERQTRWVDLIRSRLGGARGRHGDRLVRLPFVPRLRPQRKSLSKLVNCSCCCWLATCEWFSVLVCRCFPFCSFPLSLSIWCARLVSVSWCPHATRRHSSIALVVSFSACLKASQTAFIVRRRRARAHRLAPASATPLPRWRINCSPGQQRSPPGSGRRRVRHE